MTRDEGADVAICSRCGERESVRGRTVPLSEWPVSVEDLTAEEGVLIRRHRAGTLRTIPFEDSDT